MLSLGSLASAAAQPPPAAEHFSHVGGFSSGRGRGTDFAKTYATLVANPTAANQKLRLLWVGCGRDDTAFAASKSFSEFLTTHKIKHTFRETDGAHGGMVWRRYLQEISPLLFQ
jgi:enterochelin esterase-like enzyme